MALIGELAVNVVARTGGMSAGLSRAQKNLKRFQGVASNIAAGIAGAFSIYAIRGMINDFTELGDSMDKMSIRTGVSVESLSALKFAAEQSGTNIDSVGQALFRMNRRIGNFSTASGPAVRALKELGFDAKAFIGLPTEQKFMKITDALASMDDKALRDQFGFEIFGDNFRQLVPLLDQGSAGIKQLMEEAKRLGIVITEDDAKAARYFSDEMNKLSRIFQSFATQLSSVITPILTKLSKTFTSLDAGTRNLVVNIGLFVAGFGAALVIIPKIIGIFKMLIGAYQALAKAQVIQQALSGPKGWAVLAGSAVVAGVAVAGLTYAMSDLNSTVADLEQGAADIANGELPEVGESAAKSAAKARERLAQVKGEIDEINANLKKTQRSFDSISGRGSQSAFESIVNFRQNPRQETFQRDSLAALEKQAEYLERIVENTDEMADTPTLEINEVSAF